MKKTPNPAKAVSAEAIARLADKGRNVSRFFSGQGRMVQPIPLVKGETALSKTVPKA
jgi:hypothetical protein